MTLAAYRSRLLIGLAAAAAFIALGLGVIFLLEFLSGDELGTRDRRRALVTAAPPQQWQYKYRAGFKRPLLLADLDGDGWSERVVYDADKIVATGFDGVQLTTFGEKHLPPSFLPDHEGVRILPRVAVPFPSGYLGAAGDIHGQGQMSVLMTAVDREATQWRLFVLNFGADQPDRDYPLPMGTDRNEDGVWEGRWLAIGTLPPGQAGPNHAAILLANSGYDATDRQVAAVDLVTGELLWRYRMGTNPRLDAHWVGDLDGNGTAEIVLATDAPGNLRGATVNETTDARSYLLILGADGVRRCLRVLGEEMSHSRLAVADLDGDGKLEIITADDTSAPGVVNSLRVFDSAGRLQSALPLTAPCNGLATHERGPDGPGIWVAQRDGKLLHIADETGSLTVTARGHDPTGGQLRIFAQNDVLSGHDPTVAVLHLADNRLAMYDSRLKQLFVTDQLVGEVSAATVWRPQPDLALLSSGGRTMGFWHLVPGPGRNWYRLIGVLATGGALLGGAFGRRDPTKRRYELLGDLRDYLHGHDYLVHLLARLKLKLNARNRSGADNEQDLRKLAATIRADHLPTARALTRRVAREKGLTSSAGTLGELADTIDGLLRTVATAGDIEILSAAVRDLQLAGKDFNNEATALTRTLRSEFATDVVSVIDGVIEAHAGIILQQDIDVARSAPALVVHGIMPRKHLAFVLDNLVANAIRAMRDCSAGRLTIDVRYDSSQIVIAVTDTGCGIATDLHERIFEDGYSTRHGGGFGLSRSQVHVRRCRGELVLAKSEPGRGSCFVLRIPAEETATSSRLPLQRWATL